jgi:hypothetical protein
VELQNLANFWCDERFGKKIKPIQVESIDNNLFDNDTIDSFNSAKRDEVENKKEHILIVNAKTLPVVEAFFTFQNCWIKNAYSGSLEGFDWTRILSLSTLRKMELDVFIIDCLQYIETQIVNNPLVHK